MSKKSLIVQLRPRFQELRDDRVYKERDVKNILFKFARYLGCEWPDEELRKFIETQFDYD